MFFFLPAARADLRVDFPSRIPDAGTGRVTCAHAAEHESISMLSFSRLAAQNFVLAIQSILSQAQQPYDATYTESVAYQNLPT